jgi:hypothetical protein
MVAFRARELLVSFLATALLHIASGAKAPFDDKTQLLADLRSVPKPTVDSTGKFKTFSKHFTLSDPDTGEYTYLSYNCTVADDQYVNLEDSLFGVTNVTCDGTDMYITTATPQGMDDLGHSLAHSPTGLLFGGNSWMCSTVEGSEPAPIYRYQTNHSTK